MDKTKTISCDIDGILTDYPQCWLDFLELQSGVKYPSLEEAKRKEPNYKAIKDLYRSSRFKANLPVKQEGLEFLNKIRELGFMIIIATSRPLHEPKYPELQRLTAQWLTANNIPFDDLVFKNKEVDFVDRYNPPISYHIEDDLKYAYAMEKKGITTFVYNQFLDHEIALTNPKIIILPRLLNIIDHIRKGGCIK
jgi:hypothetical protein